MMQNVFFREGIENTSVTFNDLEKRMSWEQLFNETKQKLGKLNTYEAHMHAYMSFSSQIHFLTHIYIQLYNLPIDVVELVYLIACEPLLPQTGRSGINDVASAVDRRTNIQPLTSYVEHVKWEYAH